MALVELAGVSVKYDRNLVLQDIDLKIEPGEIVTLVGPNGAGKSTLLRCIIGAVKNCSGYINPKSRIRIGYVPQKLFLDYTLPISVKRFLNLPNRTNYTVLKEMLDFLDASELEARQLRSLSGGEFQKVLLARALLIKPELLILDEANQGLDHNGSNSFYSKIEEVAQNFNCAVLMASHELHFVMATSDRVICLNRKICCQGTSDHVLTTPEYKALFGDYIPSNTGIYKHNPNYRHKTGMI